MVKVYDFDIIMIIFIIFGLINLITQKGKKVTDKYIYIKYNEDKVYLLIKLLIKNLPSFYDRIHYFKIFLLCILYKL